MSSVATGLCRNGPAPAPCLAQALPNSCDLVAQPEAFWSRLGVWYGRVVDVHLRDEPSVATTLERHGAATLHLLVDWLALPPSPAPAGELSALLARHLAIHAAAACSRTLLLTIELLQNRRYDAVAACARLVLGPATVELVRAARLTPRGERLAYALLLYGCAPQNLELLTLYERAERFAYARHRLIGPVGAAGALNGAAAAWSPAQGNTPAAMNEAAVDAVLAAFEQQSGGRGRSLCLRVLPENDNCIVFIHRVLREASIHELERTLFGDEAELIVLKFGPACEVLEEHSTRGIGRQVGAAIASHLIGRHAVYADDRAVNAREAIAGFLAYLQEGNSGDALCLVELQLRQAPLDGSPALILRSQHGRPLAPALEAFAVHEIRLLDDLDDVRSISVAFTRQGAPETPHLFRIRFDRAGDDLLLHYTGAQSSRRLRQHFEAYLREVHGISVVPTAI